MSAIFKKDKESDFQLSGASGSMTETDMTNTSAMASSAFGVTGFISTIDGKNSDLYLEEGGLQDDAPTERVPLMRRRIFTNGCLLVPFTIGATILTLLIIICIFYPLMYMGFAPIITKKAIDHTQMHPTNIRITGWAYQTTNATSTTCAPYFPQSLTIIQDILFTNIPWYAQMGSSHLEPSNMDMYFNGTKFAVLYLPRIDLSNPSNDQKWSNNTESTMIVTNPTVFTQANANLIPLGPMVQGYAIWQEQGSVILQSKLLGVTAYYSGQMTKSLNISDVHYLTGPIADIQENIWDLLLCTGSIFI